MNTFRVVLEGSLLPLETGELSGFFAGRFVQASSSAEATALAIETVRREFERSTLVDHYVLQQMIVDEIVEVSVSEIELLRGFTLY
ncbi:hypothetical protein [Aurantiacibacter sp. D1-12]|uniref:hypothetical protein n=1 Tax=Aurantiacibacter sp. D1-12 TaxID=2993658 RepID=UPI00237C84EF|nr:hypothetical protein [Aurantiacibacter sp. D1-12]MDE1468461.1 hypothetical protein [Aurantiacibacter sp. D1-12]